MAYRYSVRDRAKRAKRVRRTRVYARSAGRRLNRQISGSSEYILISGGLLTYRHSEEQSICLPSRTTIRESRGSILRKHEQTYTPGSRNGALRWKDRAVSRGRPCEATARVNMDA